MGGADSDARSSVVTPQAFAAPPFEEHLLQSTLWPEVQKLYGHGNPLYCVTSSRRGDLIASACRGTKQTECAVRLTDTTTWKELAVLVAHKHTVTQLRFSASDRLLLAVSRDRGVSVFERQGSEGGAFRLAWRAEEAHERIVWGGDWAPNELLFATGSRDKHVKIWGRRSSSAEWREVHDALLPDSVTSVAWAPPQAAALGSGAGSELLAVGLETGGIFFLARSPQGVWQAPYPAVAPRQAHAAAVKRLVWRHAPPPAAGSELASCSADHSVRVFSLASGLGS